VPRGDYLYVVVKDGYIHATGALTVDSDKTVTVTMQKIS